MGKRRSVLISAVLLSCLVLVLAFASGCTEKKTEEPIKKVVKPTAPLTAEIKVDKSTAKGGDSIKYTLLIKNNTTKPMAGLKLKFANPSGLDTAMSQEGGYQPSFDQATSTWIWDAGTVNARGSYWITITMKMLPGAPSGATVGAQFTVEGDNLTSPVSSNNATTTVS